MLTAQQQSSSNALVFNKPQIRINDRILPLASLRGNTRPVILTGSRGQISRALREAEPRIAELRERGVSVIPIVVNDDDSDEKLKALKTQFRWGESSPPLVGSLAQL